MNLAFAQGGGQAGGSNPLLGLLPIVLIFVVLYLLLVLPQQRRQKKHAEMLRNLQKGERVITSGGIHGVIAGVKDNSFIIKIAENVQIEVDKAAIAQKLQT